LIAPIRLADEVKQCEDLDKEAATLTKTLKEKQQELGQLAELVERQKKDRDLLGSNNISDVFDRQSKEMLQGKLKLLEREAEAEPLNAPSDGADGLQKPVEEDTLDEEVADK